MEDKDTYIKQIAKMIRLSTIKDAFLFVLSTSEDLEDVLF